MLTQHILRIKPKNDTGSKKKEDVNIFKFEEIGIHNRSQTMPKVNNSEGTESPDDILLGLKFMPPKFLSNDENIDVAINLAMPKSLTTVAGKHKKRIHVKIENFRHQKTGSVTQHYNILEHLGKGFIYIYIYIYIRGIWNSKKSRTQIHKTNSCFEDYFKGQIHRVGSN